MAEVRDITVFLKENAKEQAPILYEASKRFKDADGEPMKWELRCLTNDEIDQIAKRNTKRVPIKGTRDFKEVRDNEQFAMDMAVKSITFPALDDEKLQESYGTIGAEATLRAMLTPGELADLVLAVNEASGFETGMNDKVKAVKNS